MNVLKRMILCKSQNRLCESFNEYIAQFCIDQIEVPGYVENFV